MGLFSQRRVSRVNEITKDTQEKRRFWLFFEIFFGQLSKLLIANVIYAVAVLPLYMGITLCFDINFSSASIVVLKGDGIDTIGLALIVLSLFITFPATLGFTYVLRNIQRREHAWLWNDFIKHTKANYLKGVLNGLITLSVYYISIFAYGMYRSGIMGTGMLSYYLSLIIVLEILLFTWMQYYVNTMIVTFDMKLSDIYKNAFIFAIGKLPTNLFITAVCIVIIYFALMIPLITMLLGISVLFSLLGFITVYSVYPTIDRTMISKEAGLKDE